MGLCSIVDITNRMVRHTSVCTYEFPSQLLVVRDSERWFNSTADYRDDLRTGELDADA